MYRIFSKNTFEVKELSDVQKMKLYLQALGDEVEKAKDVRQVQILVES